MSRWGWVITGALVMGCAAAPAPRAVSEVSRGWRVEVRPAVDLATLAVGLCFPEGMPRRLIPGVGEAARWLRAARVRGGAALVVRGGGLDLPGGAGCVDYVVDLRAMGERGSGPGVVRAAPGRWLWRPARLPSARALDVRLSAVLPARVGLALPWPREGRGEWRVPWNALRYGSDAVFGAFEGSALPVPGGALDVVWLGEPPVDRARFERWLVTAAGEVATVYARFPVARAQVLVVFEGGRRVGFGQTARGGGPGVVLYVGREASAATLGADWTATHELFHLGMPLIRWEDAWLSEGVTTVYTYLAMARSGRLPRGEVFEEWAAGFRRGAAFGTGRPLGEESAAMRQTGAYWRVYWGGGAWALGRMAAMAAAGRRFDEVLGVWAAANLDPGRSRSAVELLRWADEAVPGFGFERSARAVLGDTGFPAWQAPLHVLRGAGDVLWAPTGDAIE